MEQELSSGGADITLAWEPAQWPQTAADIPTWLQTNLDAISHYFGVFPVNRLHIALSPHRGESIHGTAYPGNLPVIIVRLGTQANLLDPRYDWVLAHELSHLALPPLKRRHHWLEEGFATYIEPLARHHSGLLSANQVWRWLLQGLPKGLPQANDRGLDFTPSWGRTYWGGALFCFLADLKIRQQTANQASLLTAIRGIRNAGGSMQSEQTWPIAELLAVGDRATGTNVLQALYAEHSAAAVSIDLPALWRDLGVDLVDNVVVFNEKAPLSQWRHALLSAPP